MNSTPDSRPDWIYGPGGQLPPPQVPAPVPPPQANRANWVLLAVAAVIFVAVIAAIFSMLDSPRDLNGNSVPESEAQPANPVTGRPDPQSMIGTATDFSSVWLTVDETNEIMENAWSDVMTGESRLFECNRWGSMPDDDWYLVFLNEYQSANDWRNPQPHEQAVIDFMYATCR